MTAANTKKVFFMAFGLAAISSNAYANDSLVNNTNGIFSNNSVVDSTFSSNASSNASRAVEHDTGFLIVPSISRLSQEQEDGAAHYDLITAGTEHLLLPVLLPALRFNNIYDIEAPIGFDTLNTSSIFYTTKQFDRLSNIGFDPVSEIAVPGNLSGPQIDNSTLSFDVNYRF